MADYVRSSWRSKAQRAIQEVLDRYAASRTPDAPYRQEEARELVSNAYPFGERKYHPYKIWLSEVRRIFGPKKKQEIKTPCVTVTPEGVICDWCNDNLCIACLSAREKWSKVANWSEWLAFLKAIDVEPEDAGIRLVFADWLEEQGWPDQSVIQRREAAEVKMPQKDEAR